MHDRKEAHLAELWDAYLHAAYADRRVRPQTRQYQAGPPSSQVIMAGHGPIPFTLQVAKKALDVFFEAFVGAFRTWRPDERPAGDLLCHKELHAAWGLYISDRLNYARRSDMQHRPAAMPGSCSCACWLASLPTKLAVVKGSPLLGLQRCIAAFTACTAVLQAGPPGAKERWKPPF